MKSFEELVREAKAEVLEISADQLNNLLNKRVAMLLIDVRSAEDFVQLKVENSVNLPAEMLMTHIEILVPKKTMPVVVMGKSEKHAALAAKTIQDLGYTQVVSLECGFAEFVRSYELK